MSRHLRRGLILLAGLATLTAIAFASGYLASRTGLQPLAGIADRVEGKLTRASGGPSETELRVDTIETTFLRLRGAVYPMPDNDWVNGGALAVWGDDLLILHNTGRILRFEEGTGLVATAIEAPDNGRADYAALAVDPAYSDMTHKPARVRFNDILYVDDAPHRGLALSYTFFDATRVCYGTRVAWLDLSGRGETARTVAVGRSDWRILFETAPCLPLNPGWTALDGMMAGGRMAYLAPGRLALGSGEYHLDGVHTYDVGIQSDDTDYGKVVEIDLVTGTARHLSKGHRNLQGVAVDGQGRLWTTEHGIRGGDELNLIREGANYGWPLETLGTLYSGQPFPVAGEQGRHNLHTPPVFAWLPSAGVSSLTHIDDFHPTWDGDLVAGSLSSEAFGQSLFRIRIDGERVVFVERIELGRRVRYLTQYGERIAVWLDSNELVLFSIEPRRDPLAEARTFLATTYDPDLAARIERQIGACGECHSYVQSDHAGAPSLNGVLGRRIGASGFAAYSDALAALGGTWDAAALRAFLLDPQTFAPGTSMPDPGLAEGPVLDGLIETLGVIDTTNTPDLGYN